jgi:hypothetical protein
MFAMVWNKSQAQISLHPFIGGNLNTVQDFDNQEVNDIFKPLAAIHFGAGIDIPVNRKLSIEPILRFNQKGYSAFVKGLDFMDLEFVQKGSYKLSVIEMPILVNFNTTYKKMKITYSIGPYVGYAVELRAQSSYKSEYYNEEYDSNSEPYFMENQVINGLNRSDFGLILGTQVELNNFTLGLHGQMSAQNLYGKLTENANKHMSLQLTLGYKFKL